MEDVSDFSGDPGLEFWKTFYDRESVASRPISDDEDNSHVRKEKSNPHCDVPTAESPEPSMPGFRIEILDFAPGWAISNEETKILLVVAVEGDQPVADSSQLYLVCGNSTNPAKVIQTGAYRCIISPQAPGFVSLYLAIDRIQQVSQALSFEIRSPASDSPGHEAEIVEFQFQRRLARLLFEFPSDTSRLFCSQDHSETASGGGTGELCSTAGFKAGDFSLPRARNRLLESIFENKLEEWSLEIAPSGGSKLLERDENGHCAIHLCAALGYTWSPALFTDSFLSLDFRDKCGWTALHWAASQGKRDMVESLLRSGARAHLVTDPTLLYCRGRTAVDLAERNPTLSSYIRMFSLYGHFVFAEDLAGKPWWRRFVGTVGFVDKVIVRWRMRERGGLCRMEALLAGEGCGQQLICCIVGSCKNVF